VAELARQLWEMRPPLVQLAEVMEDEDE
jgi:hypothetical protein